MALAADIVAETDGIIFDLDRTLVDVKSHTDYSQALADVRRLVGIWPDVTTPETAWDGPTRSCMAVLVALSGDPRWSEVSTTIEYHERMAVPQSDPMPFLIDVLEATASIPRAVVTLLPAAAARSALERHAVDIDLLVPRLPDLRPKPAPDAVSVAAKALGLDVSRLVMVGDSTWDEEAAIGAGAAFIGITNGTRSEFAPETPTVEHLGELADLYRSTS